MAGRKKAQPTQTTNSLHLEDLDPRRFEDLIRQLVYDFRAWERLEPFGRLGADEGIDIHGVESLRRPDDDGEPDEGEDEADDVPPREWRIQCKRYKRLGPGDLRAIVREVVPDPKLPPHGLIIATACEVSAKGFTAFHEEATKRGVKEQVLWTRTVIEDLLYRPANDHLLFAYCGISLQVRRRGRLTEIRRRIALKRKLLRAFGLKPDEFASDIDKDVLLRDIADEDFPYGSDGKIRLPGMADDASSQDCRFERFHPQGIIVCQFTYVGWRKADGTWDGVRDSKGPAGSVSSGIRQDLERGGATWEPPTWSKFNGHVPDDESVMLYESALIPWENILEVDPFGERGFDGVHLLCQFEGKRGPYKGGTILMSSKWRSPHFTEKFALDRALRRDLYKRLEAELVSFAQTAAGEDDANLGERHEGSVRDDSKANSE